MRFILLNDNLLPHLFVLRPQVAKLGRRFVDHRLAQLGQHGIQPGADNDAVQCALADGLGAGVDLFGLRFLHNESLADVVIRVHQSAQIVADLKKHIIRVGLRYLLHPLHFFVVLNLLRRGRVLDPPKLRLQIIQHFLDFTRCALDVLVKLASLLDRQDRSVGSGKQG